MIILAALSFLASSANAFTIPNVHKLSSAPGVVYRGSQPLGKFQELADEGITDVLIFKNDVKGEVATEIENLGKADISVTHIPMPWKDIKNFKAICKLTVQALKKVQKISHTEGRSIYFHCTAGEDRTGMLAALFRMSEQNWTAKRAYKDEMCKYGFGDSNPGKRGPVANDIRKNLLPIYSALSAAIADGKKVSESLCNDVKAGAGLDEFPSCI